MMQNPSFLFFVVVGKAEFGDLRTYYNSCHSIQKYGVLKVKINCGLQKNGECPEPIRGRSTHVPCPILSFFWWGELPWASGSDNSQIATLSPQSQFQQLKNCYKNCAGRLFQVLPPILHFVNVKGVP